jgi:hypothetical protein
VFILLAHRQRRRGVGPPGNGIELAGAESLGQLVREHESLVAAASSERWHQMLAGACLPGDVLDKVRHLPYWDKLMSALNDAEVWGAPVRAGRLGPDDLMEHRVS